MNEISEIVTKRTDSEKAQELRKEASTPVSSSTTLADRLSIIADEIVRNGKLADTTDQFAQDNYRLLKEHRIFSAMVPHELGGEEHSFTEMADLLRRLAHLHPSTALSCSMHQHIVAASRYNHINGRPGKALLGQVAANELKLVSTGAGDWLASNGEMKRTEGGFLFTATKHFASGSPAGDLLVTSGPFEEEVQGWQVLHFAVPLQSEGVTVLDNWAPMGMRGTGSNSVRLENVFVPDTSVTVRRPRGDYHTMWSVILPVALPLIMSVYRGIAEAAAEKARVHCATSRDPVTPYLIGEMENALTTAQVVVDDMIRIADELRFEASLGLTNEVLKRKTIAAAACKETAAKAVEACGGPGYLRAAGIESLLRDVMAAHFHPLQEKRQHLFSGSIAMGKEPPSQAF